MLILDLGVKVLIGIVSIFFIVFFFLTFGWSRAKYTERKINFTVASSMSFLYSFFILLGGTALLILVAIFWEYLAKYLYKFIEFLWKLF